MLCKHVNNHVFLIGVKDNSACGLAVKGLNLSSEGCQFKSCSPGCGMFSKHQKMPQLFECQTESHISGMGYCCACISVITAAARAAFCLTVNVYSSIKNMFDS